MYGFSLCCLPKNNVVYKDYKARKLTEVFARDTILIAGVIYV